jgi:hypothetical protein
MKHAFTRKNATDFYAINAPDKFRSLPNFHAMGVTQAMKLDIGLKHFGSNPGAGLSGAWDF